MYYPPARHAATVNCFGHAPFLESACFLRRFLSTQHTMSKIMQSLKITEKFCVLSRVCACVYYLTRKIFPPSRPSSLSHQAKLARVALSFFHSTRKKLPGFEGFLTVHSCGSETAICVHVCACASVYHNRKNADARMQMQACTLCVRLNYM